MNITNYSLRQCILKPSHIVFLISTLLFLNYFYTYKNSKRNSFDLNKVTIIFNDSLQSRTELFSNNLVNKRKVLNIPKNLQKKDIALNDYESIHSFHKDKYSSLYSKILQSSLYSIKFPNISADYRKQKAIKEAFLHAWNGYKKYSWGHDIYHPISKGYTDYLKGGLTIIDSLSTLIIMKLNDELELSKHFIEKNFKPKGEWSLFEFIIRYIGGFISAYYLSNDEFYKKYAIMLGEAIYPIIDKKKGFFSSRFYIQKVKTQFIASTNYSTNFLGFFKGKFKNLNNDEYCLAEVGSFQMEFLALTELTGNKKFANLSLNVYRKLWQNEKSRGLLSNTIGSGYDTYYEYFIKTYLQTRGTSSEILRHYKLLTRDIKEKLVYRFKKFVCIGVKTKYFLRPSVEHFTTFAAGMLALGTVKNNENAADEIRLAEQLTKSYFWSYRQFNSGLMPDYVLFNFKEENKDKNVIKNSKESEVHENSKESEVHKNSKESEVHKNSKESEVHENLNNEKEINDEIVNEDDVKVLILKNEYNLRPETIESIYWMWKFTGDQKYRDMAWTIFLSINRTCRVKYGFTSLTNLEKKNPDYKDEMESFFLSETLKYLYLIFSDSSLISPVDWVFNTEAHPFRILQESTVREIKDLLELKDDYLQDNTFNDFNNKNPTTKKIKKHRIITGHFD